MSRRSRRMNRVLKRAFQKRISARRREQSRTLLVETLEQRQLLAIDLQLLAGSPVVPGTNVDLSSSARQQSEMQIAVNPANPLQVAGVSTSFISGVEYDEIDVYLSQDGGSTWTRRTIGGGGTNIDDGRGATDRRFDPTVGFDANGRLYVGYGVDNTTTRELVVASSTDGGSTFSFANVLTDPSLDKFLLAAGRDPVVASQQNLYLTYVIDNGSGIVSNQVAVSTDGGATFSTSGFISDDATDDASFAAPVVGPNGELFVIWDDFDDAVGQSTIKFDVSTDAGATFGTDVILGLTNVTRGKPNGLTAAAPSNRYHITPQPDRGVLADPSMAVDPATGHLYAVYTVANGGTTDDTDIVLQKSTDGGATWSAPSVVHSASTQSQFLPWVSVDPETGGVYVAWLDARNDPSNQQVELFIARSTDGGMTFPQQERVSAAPSDQSQANPSRVAENYLEYLGLAAHGGTVYTLGPDNSAAASDLEAMVARNLGGQVRVVVTGDAAGDDTLTIRQHPSNSDYVQVTLTNAAGTETKTILKSAVNGIVANLGAGTGDVVSVEVDASFTITGGLDIQKTAGTGGALMLTGNGASSLQLDAQAAGGQLDYGAVQITFNSLATIHSNLTVDNVTVRDLDGVSTDWTVGDDGSTAGRSRVTANTASFTQFNFLNPATNLSLNGGTDSDVITLQVLDGGFAGTLNVSTGAGGDVVQVLGTSAPTQVDLDNDAGDAAVVGATLANAGTGVGDLSPLMGDLQLDGVRSLIFDNGASSADTNWSVTRSGAFGSVVVSGVTGVTTFGHASANNLTIHGGGGDDSLQVDFSSGNPLPAATVFQGAGQNSGDTLSITGGTFARIAHTFQNAHDGGIDIDSGTQTITYTGLEPIVDNNNVADRVFTFVNPTTDAQLTAQGSLTRISSNVNEQVDFSTPTNSLTINLAGTLGDTNQFSVNGLAAGFNTPLTQVVGTDGNETFNIEAMAGGGDFEFVGGVGDDTMNVATGSQQPGLLDGRLEFAADGGSDRVVVDGSGESSGKTIAWKDSQAVGIINGIFDFSGVEDFDLTTGTGDDSVTVTPSAFANFDVDLNSPPSPNPPGDVLTIDLAGTSGGTAFLSSTPGNGVVTFNAPHMPIDFVSAERVDSLNGNLDFGIGGTPAADTFLIQLDASGTNIQVFTNGTSVLDKPAADIERLAVAGLDGNDQLIMDGSNGLPVPAGAYSGIDNPNVPGLPQFRYDGGLGNDSVLYQDLPSMTDVTYGVGNGVGGGVTEGEIRAEGGGADQVLYFTGLEPATFLGSGGALTVVGDTGNNAITVDGANPAPGFFPTRVAVDAFEPAFFTGFASLTVAGHNGFDDISVRGFGAAENTLTQLNITGLQVGGGDDGSRTTVSLETNTRPADGVGIPTNITTGIGDDFIVIADVSLTVSNILGDVNVDAGGTGTDFDFLRIDDSGSVGPSETVEITGSTVSGIAGLAGIGGTITYGNVDGGLLVVASNGAGHTYNVRSTAAGLVGTQLFTGNGNDVVNVTDASTANGVVSPIQLFSEGGSDVLNVDDSADAAANTIHLNSTLLGGGAFGVPVSTGGIFGAGGILEYGNDLESINIAAGDGNNTINVDSTGVGGAAPVAQVTIDDGAGDSAFFIQGNEVASAADHTFNGNAGNDAFHLFLDAGTSFAGNTFVVNGGDPADNSSNRDTVMIHDAGGARGVGLFHQSGTSGDIDVQVDAGTTLDANGVETLQFLGDAANDDVVTLVGTTGDDDLTVAPLSVSSFLAFLNGNPWDGPSDATPFTTSFPGVAGGGSGPDIRFEGARQNGLTVHGGGAGAAGDRLYVYGRSEMALTDPATATDVFGFGTGVLIPGTGVGNAYDRMLVQDDIVQTVNNASGPLVDVNIVTPSFSQADARRRGLTVNAGSEAAPSAAGLADDITAVLSFGGFAMQINGGEPAPSFAPQGDRLNVVTPGEINIFSDKSTPPEVTITSTHPVSNQRSFGLGFSSIESAIMTPGLTSQQVNIVGDNDLPSVDQPDNYVVDGRDVDATLVPLSVLAQNPRYNPTGAPVHPDFDVDPDGDNEFYLQINGSAPIGFRNVTDLNVLGDDSAGTPSAGNDIDRLEVTPYADNVPTGWGIDVRFDEGNPGADATASPDMLVVNGVAGVAESTTVAPSAPGAGQVIVNNAATATPIVTIDYTTNTGLEINGNDGSAGDTDRLHLLGTDGVTSNGTSGRESAAVDFTATGQPGSPVVRVSDTASSAVLYELFTISQPFTFDTVTVNLLAGDDTATANAGNVGLTIAGNDGDDTLIGLGTSGLTLAGGSGDDLVIGGSGDDTIDGGAGSDHLRGGLGADRVLGGTEADVVEWNTGDGSDNIDGGAGSGDQLIISGDAAANAWTISEAGGATSLSDGTATLLAAEVEAWNLLPGAGANTIHVETLSNRSLDRIDVTLGSDADAVTADGTAGDDALSAGASGGDVSVSGLPYALSIRGADAAQNDRLTLRGLDGNDELGVTDEVAGRFTTILDGGAGDDMLRGALGNQELLGGAGDDTLFASSGDDSAAGGAGTDALVYVGSNADDIVSLTQAGNILTAAGSPFTGTTSIAAADVEQIRVETTGGDDTVTLTDLAIPTTVAAGDGNDLVDASAVSAVSVTLLGGAGSDTLLGGAADDTVDGGAGADTLSGNAGNDQLFGGADNDVLAGGAGDDEIDGGSESDVATWAVGDGTDTVDLGAGDDAVLVSGSPAAETIAVSSFGVVVNVSIGAEGLDIVNAEQLDLDGQAGNDTVSLADLSSTPIRHVSVNQSLGDDALTMDGSVTGDDIQAGLVTDTVLIQGMPYDVVVTGSNTSDALAIRGADGDDVIKASAGVESLINVTLDGGAGDDVLSADATLLGGAGNDLLVGGAGNDSMFGGAGDDVFVGNGGTDEVDGGSGSDRIAVDATAASDAITLTRTAAGALSVDVNGNVTTYTGSAAADIHAASIEGVDVSGNAGDDTLSIINDNGLLEFSEGIAYDGGAGSDRLVVSGTLAIDQAIYTVGPHLGSGTLEHTVAGSRQVVQFRNLEPVLDEVTARNAVVNGNDADNAITFGATGNLGSVSVDAHEVYRFNNKQSLQINAAGGDDSVDLNLPGTSVNGLTQVVVNGGAGHDSVTLDDDVAGAQSYNVSQLGPQSAEIATGLQGVTLSGVNSLLIRGDLASGDRLTVQGTPNDDQFVAQSGGPARSGSLALENAAFRSLTIDYTGMNSVTYDGGTQSANDSAVFETDDRDDTIRLSGSGTNSVVLEHSQATAVNSLSLIGIRSVEVNSFAGQDHVFSENVAVPLNLNAGAFGESNRLDVTTDQGAAVVTVPGSAADSLAVSVGGAVTTASGVDQLNLNVSSVTVDGTDADDRFTVTPRTASPGARIVSSAYPTVIDSFGPTITGINTGRGNDVVRVVGTTAAESISVSPSQVVTPNGTVNLASHEAMEVAGGEGSDQFHVTPGAVPIFIDGADPIGVTPGGDVLTVAAIAPGPVQLFAGPENDEGAVGVTGQQPVSFDHIERVNVTAGPGVGPAVVFATNADDEITVIARDSSTRSGADGVQDFTVSVNQGTETYFQNFSGLQIDGLAGDDDFTLRTPAPNAAVWNTDVTFVGGPGTDVVDLETPAGQALPVVIEPTGPETGLIQLPSLASTLTLSQDALPQPGDPTIGGNGGFERFNIDGETNGDVVTILGGSSGDAIVHTPSAASDAGEVRVNAWLPIGYSDLGSGSLMIDGRDGSDTLSVVGTDGRDDVRVAATTGTISVDARLPIQTAAIETLSLETLSGDDLISVSAPLPYSNVVVEGGDPGTGSDVLRITTDPNAVEAISYSPNRSNPHDQELTLGTGATFGTSGVEQIYLVADADDSLAVSTFGGDDVISVDGGTAGDRIVASSLVPLEYSGIARLTVDGNAGADQTSFALGSLSANRTYEYRGAGEDTLTIVGNDGRGDALTIRSLAGGTFSVSDVAGATLTSLDPSLGRVVVAGQGGDDQVSINVDAGLIPTLITVQGGDNHDRIEIAGSASDTLPQATYTPGPTLGSGRMAYVATAGSMTVDFTGLEPLVDLVPGTLTVNANNADNAMSYYDNAGLGAVAVDGNEVISFANKSALTLNAQAGDDVIHLNNPTAPAGLTSITVNGGDSTTGDQVVINGTPGADSVVVTPTGDDAATVTGVQGVAGVSLGTSEQLTINGLGGGDTLSVDASAASRTTVTPSATNDAGGIQVDSLIPIDFTNLGSGSVSVTGSGAAATLVAVGTNGSDGFLVPGTETILVNSRVPITTTNIGGYRLQGLSGTDTFQIVPVSGVTILVEGDDAANGDRLAVQRNTTGAAEMALRFDADPSGLLGLQSVTQTGLGTIFHRGIEELEVDARDADVTVSGTRGEDTLTVKPQSDQSALITSDIIATRYDVTGVPATRTLRITGGAAGLGGSPTGGLADKVVYEGTSAKDLIRVNTPARTVELDNLGFGFPPPVLGSYRSITLDDGTASFGDPGTIEVLEVRGNDSSDTVHVVPGAPVGNGLYVHVDGGEPQASDSLVITNLNAANAPVSLANDDFVVVGHSRNPDAGNVIVFQAGQRRPGISYNNVEVVSPNVASPGGEPNLLILGADNFEENEFRQTAAFLGAGDSINVENLAIFPDAAEHPGVPADQDYFRVVTETTGVLDFQVYFRTFDPALLPEGGQLNIRVLDKDGTPIAGDATIVPAGQPAFGTFDNTPDARIRIPAVAGQTYYLHVTGANDQVVNGYDLTVDNYAPPVPYDIELDDLPVGDGLNSDTGRSHFDNITRDNTPVIVFRLDEGILLNDLPGNGAPDSPPDEVIPIPFQGSTAAPGYRVAVFVEGIPQQPGTLPETPVGYARRIAAGVYEFDFDTDTINPAFTLADGTQFISAKVEVIDPATPAVAGFGARSQSLEIFVDTVQPPVFFGVPGAAEDGLHGDSDSGVVGDPSTFTDRVTNDTTPTFYGYAEADSFVRLYADTNGNGVVDGSDVLLGQVTAQPFDGNNQFPNGQWEITSQIDLNDPEAFPTALPHDGVRRMLVTAEDVAGNISDPQQLNIFLDTQGPQVTSVFLTSNPGYDLFDPKPSTDGPTPVADRLSIRVADLPNRSNVDPNFLYQALQRAVAENEGHFTLVGDYVGVVPISRIQFVSDPVSNGQPARGTLILTFTEPLADDRYTLTVSDTIVDPAGNSLDGESHAVEPHEVPSFPSGDGQPGGDFVARFTIDTRPELGTWAAGNIWVDTNGNTSFDPDNLDFTNRDIIYTMGYTSDDVFAGNFVDGAAATADGFDKLAVYGRVDSDWRWLVDTDNDGVPNIERVDPLGINGLPVAGRFDNNDNNGDEVAVFTGQSWFFDVNHDFRLDAASQLNTTMRGFPVVGDFDGDGFDDLATWTDDTFQIDLANGARRGWDGVADHTFRFGFIGVREHPVAADMNQDGFDDLGLWVPDRSGVAPIETGEWYFLVSGTINNSNNDQRPGGATPPTLGPSIIDRIVIDPIRSEPVVNFEPEPFGNDIYVQFGDDFALPIVGNFDPPVTPDSGGGNQTGGNSHTNFRNPLDVNDDGQVTPQDALAVITDIGQQGSRRLVGAALEAPYLDVNMDGFATPVDALAVIEGLVGRGSGEGEGSVQSALISGAAWATESTAASLSGDSDRREPSAGSDDTTVMVYPMTGGAVDPRDEALAELDASEWLSVEDAVDAVVDDLQSVWDRSGDLDWLDDDHLLD